MNGDVTLEARWHRRSASKVISPFIIFAVFDVSFRRYKLQINYSFVTFIKIETSYLVCIFIRVVLIFVVFEFIGSLCLKSFHLWKKNILCKI